MPAVQWCGQSYRVAAAAQTDLFSHTFDGPIAWNKLHITGAKTEADGDPLRPDHPYIRDILDPDVPTTTGQDLIDSLDDVRTTTVSSLSSFTAKGLDWGATKAQVFSEVEDSTAFVGMLHGEATHLYSAADHNDLLTFAGSGPDTWQAHKSASSSAYPPYWFVWNVACSTHGPDSKAGYGIGNTDQVMIEYQDRLLSVAYIDLDEDGIFDRIFLKDHVAAIWSNVLTGKMTFGDAVASANAKPQAATYTGGSGPPETFPTDPNPAILVGDPDVRYPWVYMKKSETDHASSLGKVINRLWLPLTGTGEIDWERY
jgi:hypothetical protein